MNEARLFVTRHFTWYEMDNEALEAGEWVPCVVNTDYEICSQFPHQVRNTATGRIMRESITNGGYVQVGLNDRSYFKHFLIARQFIPNPNPQVNTDVDHVNHIRSDNRLENLRWVTKSQNQRNRLSHRGVACEYIDLLPDNVIPISVYNGYELDGYCFSPETQLCYYDNGLRFRVLGYYETQSGGRRIQVRDTRNVGHTLYLNKWLRDT